MEQRLEPSDILMHLKSSWEIPWKIRKIRVIWNFRTCIKFQYSYHSSNQVNTLLQHGQLSVYSSIAFRENKKLKLFCKWLRYDMGLLRWNCGRHIKDDLYKKLTSNYFQAYTCRMCVCEIAWSSCCDNALNKFNIFFFFHFVKCFLYVSKQIY